MTDITALAQREKFEAWAHSQKLSLAYGDCGYAFSSTEMAWRAWRASSPELVDALEKSDSRLHEVAVACATAEQALEKAQAKNALVAGGIEASTKLHERIAELDAELEREREKSRRVMSRIAELESRTVKLPHRNLGHPKLFLLCPFPYYDAEDIEKALSAAGIKWEDE